VAIRVAVLTVAIFLAVACPATAAISSCLYCHQVHYAAISSCSGCHRGDERTFRKEVAHGKLIPGGLVRYRIPGDTSAETGMRWIERTGCRRCHTIKRVGNRLATNLDRLAGRHPVQIRESIMRPVAFMPDFRFDAVTASLLVNAILAAAEPVEINRRTTPVTVRFTVNRRDVENIFAKRCGGCHRLLSERFGALGTGNAGPNLAGLLTDHYPRTFARGEPWTGRRLKSWLANPRTSRPLARMQPVPLEKAEFRQLMEILGGSGDLPNAVKLPVTPQNGEP
jgi:cytochrome c2